MNGDVGAHHDRWDPDLLTLYSLTDIVLVLVLMSGQRLYPKAVGDSVKKHFAAVSRQSLPPKTPHPSPLTHPTS